MERFIVFCLVFLLFFTLDVKALNRLSISAGVGYDVSELTSNSYRDITQALITQGQLEFSLSRNLQLFVDLSQGKTKSASMLVGADLKDLKGLYYRRTIGFLTTKDLMAFKAGLGLGLELDRERFSWVGNNDNTQERTWLWQRNSLGVSLILGLEYVKERFTMKSQLSYSPLFPSTDITTASDENQWESWENRSLKASLVKLNFETGLTLSENICLVGGFYYRVYSSKEQEVDTIYTNSSDHGETMRNLIAEKVLETNETLLCGLKFKF